MSLELIKDYVKLNQVVLMSKTRSVFEHDCIVPDINPDIAKILVIDGTAIVDSTTVQKNSIAVNFTIYYKILYMSDGGDAAIKAINSKSTHTLTIDAAGAEASATCKIDCDVEHLDYTLLNSRKLGLRNVVRVSSQVFNAVEQGLTVGLEGVDGIQQQRETFCLSSCTEMLSEQLPITEIFELTSGKIAVVEILRSDARITDVSMVMVGDHLNVRGQLTINTLYVSDDQSQSLQILENTTSFTHALQLSTINENIIWDLDTILSSFKLVVEEDTDGEMRIIKIDAMIKINAKGYDSRTIDILTDAYSLAAKFNVEKEIVKATQQVGELNTQFVLKEIISKPEGSPDVYQIFNALGHIGQCESEIVDEKISLEGFINCNMLYMSQDVSQPLASFTREIPFKQLFDQKGITADMKVSVKLEIEHCSYSILSISEIELRLAISVKAFITKINELPIITRVSEEELDENMAKKLADRPSILIYVVQPGDTLWKIGKMYKMPLSLIQSLNEIKNPDIIYAGQKLILPGKS